MKVLLAGHTTPKPISGTSGMGIGISRYIYNLGRELVKLDHDVKLLIRDDYKPKEKWIETVYAPKKSWILYPYFLKRKIAKIQADVYHSDYVTTGSAIIKAEKQPSVVSIHDVIPFTYKETELSKADKIRVKWYMKCFKEIKSADAIVVLSEFSKKETLRLTDIPKDRLHVVYAGVDIDRFFPFEKRPHKKIRIGYLGGLDGRKNVTLLVEAFKLLVKRYDNIELHVGGTGENLAKFREMKIPNAHFYGFIPDKKINGFLNSLDMFVFPTLGEGFGLPVLEAMATRTATLATNTSSMPEVIGDAGLLFKPTIDSLSAGIEKMINNPTLRKRFAEKALKRSRAFTWRRCAKETVKIYNKVR